MFKCRICQEKDAQISLLKAQVDDLRSLVLPKEKTTVDASPVELESDALLTGSQDTIEIELSEDEQKIISERDRILSGNY